jgi:hypothetical protein
MTGAEEVSCSGEGDKARGLSLKIVCLIVYAFVSEPCIEARWSEWVRAE